MKIASWNVNSLKVRLPHVLDWLDAAAPDVLCLQETKLTDENFPAAEINAAGYQVVYSGQKTYNGVAIISKQAVHDVIMDLPGLDDPQRRILAATIGGVRVLDLYVVNGQEVGSDKYAHKLEWLGKVTSHIETELREHERLVVLGDFNIAPDDRDVYDPDAWRERILCSTRSARHCKSCSMPDSSTPFGCLTRMRGASAGGTTARPPFGETWACASTSSWPATYSPMPVPPASLTGNPGGWSGPRTMPLCWRSSVFKTGAQTRIQAGVFKCDAEFLQQLAVIHPARVLQK